jgi:putative peptide zinc metalloprotease protein
MTESIFSDQWYRLSGLHPFLRPTVTVERQWVRGELWYLFTAANGASTYRINKTAYAFIGRCNGNLTIAQVWEDLLAAEPEATLTQHEVIELLITVQSKGFVEFEKTADARQLLKDILVERGRENRQRLNPLSFKVKLGNPQRWLGKLEWLAPLIFGPAGLTLFILVLLVGGFVAIDEFTRLQSFASQWLSTPKLILLVWVVYPVIKLVHEVAHALAVQRWGGRVQEMGISLMLLFPVPYVDASDANRFARSYQRALVGAAGIFAELTLAALALLVWKVSQAGLVQDIAFVVAFTGGVSTLLFNGNPLIKMDAYFVLSDLAQMPNLAQRSQTFFTNAVKKVLLGVKGLRPTPRQPGELLWLMGYSPLAWLYRLCVSVWMIIWIGEFSPTLGYAMTAMAFVTLLIMPLGKGFWFLRREVSAGPGSGYWQTQMRAALLVACVIGLFCFAPLPERRVIAGVVWMADQAQVKALSDGFVEQVLTEQGQKIATGDGVIELSDPAKVSRLNRLKARYLGLEAALAQSMVLDLGKARGLQLELEQLGREIAMESERIGDLTAKAQAAGTVFVKDANDLAGKFVKRGDVLGYVMAPANSAEHLKPIVRVAVEQDDVSLLKGRVKGVQVQLAGNADASYQSRLVRDMPAALVKLPSAALGDRGGGSLTTDPQDKDALRTARPTYSFDVAMPELAIENNGYVGQKAFVRFDLGNSPLAVQWLRQAQQTVLMKFAPKDI